MNLSSSTSQSFARRVITTIILRPHLSFVGCLEADVVFFFIAIFSISTLSIVS
jgi:hypothetical protein